ncbi:hypothetical protein FHS16_002524 [Paenibacillus endophyticus]|uniref:Uncharacterized protein n=1 Tax=Paenibacillus endophyticus TaxID=1294268 RepID=A0A7W5C835_9BACL|nr:ABC-three component system middle component 1 [Paenibacillus endophyticus]MBB3152474.1 hypothetical protein [Paenibacillus endophyticus]
MMIEEVRNILQVKGGFRLLFVDVGGRELLFESHDSRLDYLESELLQRSFRDNGLEAWINDHRIAVTKVYESFTYFKESWKDNQIVISNLLNHLPLKYKNNLYFLIILEFDSEQDLSNELQMEKNKAEKNAKYCRKYILQDEDDLERIPFFHDVENRNADSFSYENKFIELLIHDSHGLDPSIIQVINDYFKPEMRTLLQDKSKLKLTIEKRFGGEIGHAVTPDEY